MGSQRVAWVWIPKLLAMTSTKPESRSACYSCSEKICRWNHVGWESAMLSQLLEGPLSMSSIVVGGPLFDVKFVREALLGRAGLTGAVCPEFWHTSVDFERARELAEADLP